MADSASPPAHAVARPPVLVLTDDTEAAAIVTSRHLALALRRLGHRAVVRDTRLVRWSATAAAPEHPARRDAFEVAVVAKWAKLVEDYGIGLVLSLDSHWLISKNLFVDDPNVRAVHSFWLNAMAPSALPFPLDLRAVLSAAKVTHHCPTRAQEEALRALGAARVQRSALAAPTEYLRLDAPCEIRDRLAFIGDPDRSAALAALVPRLADRGRLDVYGPPAAWKARGVAARPVPPPLALPALYRRYPAVLHDGTGTRLFDLAACARLSLSANDPELRACYAEDEAVMAPDAEALEAAAEEIVHNPDAALAAGEKARRRTARDHLWENRLEAALA